MKDARQLPGDRVMVVGFGVAGEAATRQLLRRGCKVTLVEDFPSDSLQDKVSRLEAQYSSALRLVSRSQGDSADDLLNAIDLVVPSPGIPPHHPLVSTAIRRSVPIWSEFEVAACWSSVPLLAITGTNGKTTVTTLVEQMLRAGGIKAVSAGNTEVPLIDAIEDHSIEMFVVEASSFRLAFSDSFHPRVGVWLNVAEDHLDWHESMANYVDAKAGIWRRQGPDDVAIANADDPVVMSEAANVRSRLVTFGHERGDWRVDGSVFRCPDGSELLGVDELWRTMPHDLTNALAAAAAATAAGLSSEPIVSALRSFRGLPHRVYLVGQHRGIDYYDDSKATDPHAVLAAIRGFPSVVLIAGGRNKGLDLSVLGSQAANLRHVVAIGEAADEIRSAFEGRAPVSVATSMDDAVQVASECARAGDVVLLSPGCASFDWYLSYAERGDDFVRAVTELQGGAS